MFDEYKQELLKSELDEYDTLDVDTIIGKIDTNHVENELNKRVNEGKLSKEEFEKQINRITKNGQHQILGDGIDFGIKKI